MNNEEQEIILKSYSNIWKIERRLEHVGGVKIPSTAIENALYYIACLSIEIFIMLIIPLFRGMPVIVIFGLPYLVATFLKKVKLDGKNPLKFFNSLIKYLISPKVYVRFRPQKRNNIATYDGIVGYRSIILRKSN